MSTPTIVGHFSTWLIAAWILWLIWAAGQVVWYRRSRTADADVIVEAAPAPEPPAAERSVALRAPGPALRSMTPAAAPRAADQSADAPPPPDAPAGDVPEDDITPS